MPCVYHELLSSLSRAHLLFLVIPAVRSLARAYWVTFIFLQLEAEVAEKKKNLTKELKKIDEDYAKAVSSNRIWEYLNA